MKPQLFWAADVETSDQAVEMMQRIGQIIDGVKVGLELHSACSTTGDRIVQQMKVFHKRIFLDLKFHDIPETVRRATLAVAKSGADFLSVHAAGGPKMLEAAVAGAKEAGTGLKIWAVTALTSMDSAQFAKTGVSVDDVRELVLKRARLAYETGCGGVVASAQETKAIRELFPDRSFTITTPGLNLLGGVRNDDQKRVGTAFDACRDGTGFCIVGRPIRDASDPAAAANTFKEEMAQGWELSRFK